MKWAVRIAAVGTALAAQAGAQQAGVIDWSSLGLADEAGIPRANLSGQSGDVAWSLTWRVDGDTDRFEQAPGLGQDYISYEAGAQAGFTGYAQLAFDTNSIAGEQRPPVSDRIVLFVNFNETVTNLSFALTDVDRQTFHDTVNVFVDRGNGFENARGGAFPQPTLGANVAQGGSTYGNGWQGTGNTAGTSTASNVTFDFGGTGVTRFVVAYASGQQGTAQNPGNQQIGLSDITWNGPPPPPGADLSLTKTVSEAFPTVGDQVTYTVTLANAGPDAADVVVRDLLPSGVTYVSDSADGAYTPGDGLWQVPGPVPSGGTRTLSIVATVQPNGQRTNLAEVWTSSVQDADSTPGNSDQDPFEDDTAQVTIEPGGQPGTPGQAPALSCAPNRLDWAANPWPSGSLAQSYTAAGTAFDFALTGNGAAFLNSANDGQTPVTGRDVSGGRATPDDNVYILVNQQARASTVRIGVDVGVPGVGVSELQFSIFDVDYGGGQFEDRIAVAGYKGGEFVSPTLTPSSGNRVQNGQALGTSGVPNDGGGGNLTVTFRSPVDNLVITYGNGARAPADPGQQAIGLDDLLFCQATGAQLSAAKSVSVYDPLGEGLYMLPGVDARYAITVANTGDGATDPDTVFLSDKLPADVTFWSGDVDEGGPQTGPVGFSQSGAGVTLGAGDVGFAATQASPASFAACTYTPNGGYDPAVRHVCFRPRGALQAGNPDPSFTVWFRARID